MSISITESALLPVRRDGQISISMVSAGGGGAGSGSSGNVASSDHNLLTNLQGGQAAQYYHLDASEYTELTDWLDSIVLDSDGSMTLSGNIIMPDGGSIGQAAGPLLTFDDSNNYLEITGCKVGIGTATPTQALSVIGTILAGNTDDHGLFLHGEGGATHYNWQIGQQTIIDTGLDFTPSTAVGGTTFTTPVMVLKQNGTVGIGITAPVNRLHLNGIQAAPATSGIAQNGILRIGDTDTAVCIDMGVLGSGAYSWIQSRAYTGYDTNYVLSLNPNGGNVGIGTIASNAKLESLATTEQLRLSYDTTHYTKFEVAATGAMTITPLAGQDLLIALSTTGDFIVNTDDLVVDTSSGFVGVGFTTPLSALCINGGLHVGGESAAGDNNVLVDGTIKSESIESVTAYVTGFFGDGYKVVESGGETTAEFDNLIVRKALKAFTLEIDEIDVVGGSLVISPASGTAYSVGYAVPEWTSWVNVSFNTFVSSGLNITSATNTDAGTNKYASLNNYAEYDISDNEVLTIHYNLTINSGNAIVLFTDGVWDEGADGWLLSAGAHDLVLTSNGDRTITLYIGVNLWGATNFSLTDVTITTDIPKIVFDTNNNVNPIQFRVDDYLAAQQWVNYDHTVIESFRGLVLGVHQSATLNDAYIKVDVVSGDVWDGMKLAQLGNAGSDSESIERQSLLYLTSSDANNPFIEGHTGVDSGVLDDTTRQFRLGNLEGITDSVLGALSGFGIYTQHGYFTGISAFGSSIGLDPETVDTNNVSIVGCNIYESSRNDDTGSLYISSIGYQGGETHYRNTYIGDGKGGYLLQCLGASSIAAIHQAFGFVPRAFSNNWDESAKLTSTLFIMEAAGGDLTLTLPDSDDIIDQFGAGKSAQNPMIIVINVDTNNNLTVTTKSGSDTFYTTNSDYTKTYILNPNCIAMMVFAENDVGSTAEGDWYVLGV